MLGRSRFTLALTLFCWLGYIVPAAAADPPQSVEMSGLMKRDKWRKFLKKYCDGDKRAIKKFAELKAKKQQRRAQIQRCIESAMGTEYVKALGECGMSPEEDRDTSDKFCEDGEPKKLSKEELKGKGKGASELGKKARECLEKKGVKPPASAVKKQNQCLMSLKKKWRPES